MRTRRQFLQNGLATVAAVSIGHSKQPAKDRWKSLFDGKTLNGWRAIPRAGVHRLLRGKEGKLCTRETLHADLLKWHRANRTPPIVLKHKGDWQVRDGAIIGGQKPAGSRLGAYLQTEDTYGDMELEYEIRPDWATDTGVLIRQHAVGTVGFQILCDHRPNGGIGGIYTNGLGSYIAAPFVVDGDQGRNFTVKNFRAGKPDLRFKQGKVQDPATFESFRQVWKLNDWNRFRVRAVGAEPKITVWVNDLKIGTVDTADPGVKNYDPEMIQRLVGTKGHIGLEVHSNGPQPGWDQWSKGAVSRWRNIRVREI